MAGERKHDMINILESGSNRVQFGKESYLSIPFISRYHVWVPTILLVISKIELLYSNILLLFL